MAIIMPNHTTPAHLQKHLRRNATAIMAGTFDVKPRRDVLTSLLNGVSSYKEVEKDEESRRNRKKEKKERDRERKRQKAADRRQQTALGEDIVNAAVTSEPDIARPKGVGAPRAYSPSWRARPAIHIATLQRSVSVTPPPCTSPIHLHSSPVSTPGPSLSSSTSRTSSKRPRTPDDDEELDSHELTGSSPAPTQPRKKRVPVKKGWKGWVEGSPPPSKKLINLDGAPVLQERRTRSGKNFDAISVGKDGWVCE